MTRFRALSCLLPLVLLCGCSSMRGLLGSPARRPAAPPVMAAQAPPVVTTQAPPPAQAPQPDEWCMRVAANERGIAASGGFDAATQDRITVQAYQQCAALKAS